MVDEPSKGGPDDSESQYLENIPSNLTLQMILDRIKVNDDELKTMLVLSGVTRAYLDPILFMKMVPIKGVEGKLREEINKFLITLRQKGVQKMKAMVMEATMMGAQETQKKSSEEVFREMREITDSTSNLFVDDIGIKTDDLDFE